MEAQSIMQWLLPPLLGAVIGYVTNFIAIRMLFRPLHPWYVANWRLPLTPGIIPSKRQKLARRIGVMVGEHLLTAEDVAATLEQPHVQQQLETLVREQLEQLWQRDLGPVATQLPAEVCRNLDDWLRDSCGKWVHQGVSYLQTAAGQQQLAEVLLPMLRHLQWWRLEDSLSPAAYQQLRQRLDELLQQWLGHPSCHQLLEQHLDKGWKRLAADERPLSQCLPESLQEALLQQAEDITPNLVAGLEGWLLSEHTQKQLVAQARKALEEYIQSVDGLAALASLLDMEQIYERLPSTVERFSRRVLAALHEPENQEHLQQLVRQEVQKLLDRPIGSWLANLSYERSEQLQQQLLQRLEQWLQRPALRQELLGMLEKGVQHVAGRPVGVWLRRSWGAFSTEDAAQWLSRQLTQGLDSASAQEDLSASCYSWLQHWLYERPVGRLERLLPLGSRQSLEKTLVARLQQTLVAEVPALVTAMDLPQVVEDKVNQLDILEVEGLLMGIMKEQFKYINLFGALLGFVIGCLNLLVWQLG